MHWPELLACLSSLAEQVEEARAPKHGASCSLAGGTLGPHFLGCEHPVRSGSSKLKTVHPKKYSVQGQEKLPGPLHAACCLLGLAAWGRPAGLWAPGRPDASPAPFPVGQAFGSSQPPSCSQGHSLGPAWDQVGPGTTL